MNSNANPFAQPRFTAEGIEHSDQAEILKQLNCDFGQGYLFSKPMTEDAVIDYLRSC